MDAFASLPQGAGNIPPEEESTSQLGALPIAVPQA
jgi:hypothetical protein